MLRNMLFKFGADKLFQILTVNCHHEGGANNHTG